MVNGTILALGSFARFGARGGGRIMGAETDVNNELAEVGGFSESDRKLYLFRFIAAVYV